MSNTADRHDVVVVTGASGGIGRATAKLFAERGASVALLARGERGLAAARADVEALGGTARVVSRRHRGRRSPRRGGRPGRGGAGRDRRLGQRRVHLGLRPLRRHRGRRVPAGHRGQLSRVRQRHPVGPAADASARPRHDRAGRLDPGLPRHPAAERLLRGQARDPGLPRVGAHRAAARAEPRPGDHGPDAGGEHPAVLLGALPAAAPGTAGAADLPAGGRCAGRRVRRRPSGPAGVLGGGEHCRDAARQRGGPGSSGPLPGPHRLLRPADRGVPSPTTSRRTCGNRPTGRTDATSAPTASSTTGRTDGPPRCGPPSTTRLVLAAATGVVALGLATLRASRSRR